MEQAHLTHVEQDGAYWIASCMCGWSNVAKLKKDAIRMAEKHWLSMPVVT